MDRKMGIRLELFVQDMEASIAFYARVLAFEVARHEPDEYASLRQGGVLLGMAPVAKLPEEGGYFGRGIGGRRGRATRPRCGRGASDHRAASGPSLGA